MSHSWSAALILGTLALSTGCQVYVGSDDSHEPRRNPASGACVRGDLASGTIEFDADWGLCTSGCNDLGEQACLAAHACQAIYVLPCAPDTSGPPATPSQFAACWEVAHDTSDYTGDCVGLGDPFECARHDYCQAIRGRTDCAADGSFYLGDFQFCWSESPVPPPVPNPVVTIP